MKHIYMDYAAATPVDARVLQAMMPYLTTEFGNPSSLHFFGQQARAAVQQSRQAVANALGVKSDSIIFTGGGTEGDNLAILGYLRSNAPRHGHLITTAVEHHAILNTFRTLAAAGYDVTFLPVDEAGRVRVTDVADAIRPDTVLISVMYANNETGVIQPIREIGLLARQRHIVFHVDAVQAWGYAAIEPEKAGIDMLTLCSHKIYGPKGVGALYVRPGIHLAAAVYGGPQEYHLRAGTENVPAIVGFGAAASLLEQERYGRCQHARKLKQHMVDSLLLHTDRYHLNGSLEKALPNILNFSVDGWTSDVLLIALDMQGIAVSAGSACEAGALEPSHVLQAMGIEPRWLRSSLRFSFGEEMTLDDVTYAANTIKTLVRDEARQKGAS
jgi:cysteine desulfurase